MPDSSRARPRRPAYHALLLGLLLGAAGCAASGSVSGKVTYKGQPLGGGTVLFASPGKASVTADIAPDGSYTIAKIPAGPVHIAVETKSAKANRAPKGMMPPKGVEVPPEAEQSPVYGGAGRAGGKYVPIPEQYADPDKSDLSYTVKGGPQTYDINLQ